MSQEDIKLIHTSYFRPRYYPVKGDVAPAQIDRLQDLSASIALNREKIREIGRDGTVSWRNRTPTVRVTARQLEYGEIEFWQKLANVVGSDTDITLNDFKTAKGDIVGYKTDDNGTFLGSVWYPKLRTAGFGLTIGDPQAQIERSFSFVGEDEIILQGNNKYFNYQRFPSSFTVSAPAPVLDPDNSGQYMLKVVRVNTSAGTTDELTFSTVTTTASSTTYNTTSSTVKCATVAGDVIKVYYSAATWNAVTQGATQFTNNDTDAGALLADAASIYLYTTADNYVYRLQSIGIDVSFDRTDYYEIGNKEVVQTGVREKTVRVTLGRILEAYTIEEVLRGKAAGYGIVNPRNFGNTNTLRVKLYGNSQKNSFNIGYKMTGLAPTGFDNGVPLNDYVTRGATLEGEDLTISNVEATINA
jgi:hypothetical protein